MPTSQARKMLPDGVCAIKLVQACLHGDKNRFPATDTLTSSNNVVTEVGQCPGYLALLELH